MSSTLRRIGLAADTRPSNGSEHTGGTERLYSPLGAIVDVLMRANNDDDIDGILIEHAVNGPKGAAAFDAELKGAEAVERAP